MLSNIKNLEVLIKLRHLSEGLDSKWGLLNSTKDNVNHLINEAQSIVNRYGTEAGKDAFQKDLESIQLIRGEMVINLGKFKDMILDKSSDNSKDIYQKFLKSTEDIATLFAKTGRYPTDYFQGLDSSEWFGIWGVIQSNIYTVQGIGQSAYIQLQMFEEFSKQEIDDLNKEIVKYIPKTYHLEDAIQYRSEYLTQLAQMEEEANKKDNLWDRFLNLLAGNVPFKQTPQERVMMMRWLDGEKGDL